MYDFPIFEVKKFLLLISIAVISIIQICSLLIMYGETNDWLIAMFVIHVYFLNSSECEPVLSKYKLSDVIL